MRSLSGATSPDAARAASRLKCHPPPPLGLHRRARRRSPPAVTGVGYLAGGTDYDAADGPRAPASILATRAHGRGVRPHPRRPPRAVRLRVLR